MVNIIKREWMRLFKQPKVMVTTFLMPCVLLFFIMGIFLSGLLEGGSQNIAVITESPEVAEFIADNNSYHNILYYKKWDEELETLYDKGKIGVILELETDTKTVLMRYDSIKLSSNEILVTTQDFVRELSLFLQNEELFEDFMSNQLPILEKDVCSIMEKEKEQLKKMISIIVAVLIFMVGQPLANFAVDAYVGEQERGTYDSIRLSGVEVIQFILGKTVFTVLIGLVSGVLQVITILLGIWYFAGSFGVENYVDNTLMMAVTTIITSCISLAILVAVLIYVSTYFEKIRDAGTYASIGTLVFTLLSQLSNVIEGAVLDYLPLVNMNSLILRNAHGSASILPLLVSVLLGVAVVIVITKMSVFKLRSKEM